MKIGVFAGSFCPVTNGHVNAIEVASKLVDKLVVVVGVNVNKSYVIPVQARVQMLQQSLAHLSNVEITSTDGMMTDFCKQIGATVMIKSIRNATDLQQVVDLADVNCDFWNGQTVFVVGDKKWRYVSSSLVRELASLNQDISPYVPQCCLQQILSFLTR